MGRENSPVAAMGIGADDWLQRVCGKSRVMEIICIFILMMDTRISALSKQTVL